MRIAAFSDVHGNLLALEAVLADISRRGVDGMVCLGDHLSGPFDPIGVADRLMGLGIPGISGNHDRFIVEGRDDDWDIDALVRQMIAPAQSDWLASLPKTRIIDGTVFCCHGTPADDNTLWLDGLDSEGVLFHRPRAFIEAEAAGFAYPVLLCGHSHIPRTLRLADGRLVVNPGSVGLPMALGSTDARYAIIETRGDSWAAELHVVPYDYRAAAAQAQAAGFLAWTEAIATGWSTPRDL